MKDGLHIGANGIKCWYKDGLLHREDGPAIIWSDGTQHWYKNGKCHRDDGPATIYANGDQHWYKNGKPYEPSAHELMAWKMNERRTIH